MAQNYAGALGVLQLQNTPQTMPGSISSPDTFPFPTLCRRVPDAWVENVVFGGDDQKILASFIETARGLVKEGAVAITSNCGFTIKFQKAMAHALPVPVSMSSLLLLPYLTSTIEGRIGILTFDSRPLTPDLLKLAGISSSERIAIAGIEGSTTWKIMSTPENNYTVEQMADDIMKSIEDMRRKHPDIAAILFECAGFPPTATIVRERIKLPIYDAATNASLLMNGLRMPAAARVKELA